MSSFQFLYFPFCCMALAESFEEDDAAGDGNIQRFHWTSRWQRHYKIAAFAGEFVQSAAFAAKHNSRRRSVIHFGVAFVGALVQTDEPIAGFLRSEERRVGKEG